MGFLAALFKRRVLAWLATFVLTFGGFYLWKHRLEVRIEEQVMAKIRKDELELMRALERKSAERAAALQEALSDATDELNAIRRENRAMRSRLNAIATEDPTVEEYFRGRVPGAVLDELRRYGQDEAG